MVPPGFQKYRLEEISEILIEELGKLPEHSANIIISGSGNHKVWGPAAPYIEKAHSEKKCRFKFLLGPIISADEHGKSALVELANNGHIELYVSYRRQERNGRLFSLDDNYGVSSGTYLWLEAHHEPLESFRATRHFEVGNGRGDYEIHEFMERFKFLVFTNSEFYPRSMHPKENFLVLSEPEIRKVIERHNKKICSFDLMRRLEIEKYLTNQQSLNL